MKTVTHHNAAVAIWPDRTDETTLATPATYSRNNEKESRMSTSAPADELGEPDPDLQRPPQLSLDEARHEPNVARAPVARCADGNGTMVGLFFSDHVVDIARARAMCAVCPLQSQCLAGALEREEPWGVWGGQLLSGGRIIAGRRPCGRPPKVPQPEVVYDEMGPVGATLVSA